MRLEFEDFICIGGEMDEYITRDWAAGPLEADWAVYDAYWDGYEGGDGLLVCCRNGELFGYSLSYYEDADLDIRWSESNLVDLNSNLENYANVVEFARKKLLENKND